MVLGGQRRERQAQAGRHLAHLGQRPLNRHRVRFDEQLAVQAEHAVVDLDRTGDVAGHRRHAQLMHRARGDVGRHRDIAGAAAEHQGHRARIIARIDGERFVDHLEQLDAAADIAGGVLDADDVLDRRQARDGLVGHVGHGTARHVVQDDRQVHAFRDGAEMAVHALLRRTVVIGNDLQRGVGAAFLRMAGQRDRFRGRVAAGAGDDRDAAGDVIDGQLDEFAMLFRRHGGGFARRAHDDDRVRAFRDVPVDQLAQGIAVKTAVFEHRSDECYDTALNHNLGRAIQ